MESSKGQECIERFETLLRDWEKLEIKQNTYLLLPVSRVFAADTLGLAFN